MKHIHEIGDKIAFNNMKARLYKSVCSINRMIYDMMAYKDTTIVNINSTGDITGIIIDGQYHSGNPIFTKYEVGEYLIVSRKVDMTAKDSFTQSFLNTYCKQESNDDKLLKSIRELNSEREKIIEEIDGYDEQIQRCRNRYTEINLEIKTLKYELLGEDE